MKNKHISVSTTVSTICLCLMSLLNLHLFNPFDDTENVSTISQLLYWLSLQIMFCNVATAPWLNPQKDLVCSQLYLTWCIAINVCIISSIRQLTYKVTYTRQFLNNEWQCKLHRDKKDKDTIVSILFFRALYP